MASKGPQSRAERTAALLQEQRAHERRRNLITVGAVVAVLAVIAGLTYFSLARQDKTGDTGATPSGVVDDYVIPYGQDDAPMTIVLWEDFQCPACNVFNQQVRTDLAQAVDEGKVKLEYRMVAFLDRASTDDYSSRALNAAMVVLDTAGVDVWHDFYDLLYENQPAEGGAGLSDDELIDLAVQAGADREKIEQPIRDNKFEVWVDNATAQMSKEEIPGTPTVYIDGEYAGDNPNDSAAAVLEALK